METWRELAVPGIPSVECKGCRSVAVGPLKCSLTDCCRHFEDGAGNFCVGRRAWLAIWAVFED